ncbi:MAG TPA: alpha-hydroxy acid oxidase [Luteitalea sp.]|nr:alpha-hydroxy acid oxidase [Luteitalea sp.]
MSDPALPSQGTSPTADFQSAVAACTCLDDYEALARQALDPRVWAYLAGGGADEFTLRWNREAFASVMLQSRVLADMAGAHTRLTLFEQPFDYPILLAPVAHQTLFHQDGELATARGASAMRAGQIVSMQASTSFEAIAQQSTVPPWCQVYPLRDDTLMAELVARVERAGYRAIVVTADAPVNGLRNREQRTGFTWPDSVRAVNLPGGALPQPDLPAPPASPLFSGFLHEAPTWPALRRLLRVTRLPVLLKGVLSVEDAQRAVSEGVAGLIVSNHGGRVLDTVPATLDALPPIVEAVGDRTPVLLDGGIRRGTDVFKALALGARAVLVGRPYIHGLAVAGPAGVAHVLALLRAELEVAMTLTGCSSLTRIGRHALWTGGYARDRLIP